MTLAGLLPLKYAFAQMTYLPACRLRVASVFGLMLIGVGPIALVEKPLLGPVEPDGPEGPVAPDGPAGPCVPAGPAGPALRASAARSASLT